MRTHVIKSEMLAQFGASSKLNAEWDFVSMQSTEGRRAASEFLDALIDDLSKRSMSRFTRGTMGLSN
jgi:NTE family protein